MRHVSRLSEGVTGSIYDIRTDGCAYVCVCVDREESMRREGRARGDSGQRGNVPHSTCACVIGVCIYVCARVFHLPLISAKLVFVPRSLIVTRGRHARFASRYGSRRRKSTYL